MPSYYDSAEWKILRNGALDRADYQCERCGSIVNLHVHHIYGLMRKHDLEVLCGKCHANHHNRQELAEFGHTYKKRQLETFQSLGTVSTDWIWTGEVEHAEGPCELCGYEGLKWAYPLISSVQTGSQVLMVGSECVMTYSKAERNNVIKAMGQAKKASVLAAQANISLREAQFILSKHRRRIDKKDGKYVFWAFKGFLFGTIHNEAKLHTYEISNAVATMLLRGDVTPIDLEYLKNARKMMRQSEKVESTQDQHSGRMMGVC